MADEYIKREDVIAELSKRSQYVCDNDFGVIIHAENVINAIPAADVRPVVRGRWLNVVSAIVDTTGNCSECRKEAVWRTRNKPYTICPNCGAMMDLEE